MDNFLPRSEELGKFLGFSSEEVVPILENALLNPLEGFLSRSGKQLRRQLLQLGFQLSDRKTASFENFLGDAGSVIEAIHAASLVVDDIQDGSLERRGKPTLHRELGTNLALNAGNWLYFWPFEKLRSWDIPADVKLALYELSHECLLQAHFGQGIDLATLIDEVVPDEVEAVCLASLRLKTGALTRLAMEFGAVLGGASEERRKAIREFGIDFGVALQMFDDLGNANALPSDPKRFEDLKLRRPTWLWAVVQRLHPDRYQAFIEAVRLLPEEAPLQHWLEGGVLDEGKKSAAKELDGSVERLEKAVGVLSASGVKTLSETLKKAYG